LGLGESLDGIERPEEVLGFGGRRDGKRDEFSAKQCGSGVSQLGFSEPRFATNQQRAIGSRSTLDRQFVFFI
jgi:hypothetical protein